MEKQLRIRKHYHFSERDKTIIRCGIIGIAVNLVLFILKISVAGIIHSQAIFLDAENGLADMISVLIVILSIVLAARKADKQHPFGFGRAEYLISLIASTAILYMGVHGIIESVRKIRNPGEPPEYTGIAAVLMIVSIIFKIVFGRQAKKIGKREQSVTLTISGIESTHDSLISMLILVAMIVYKASGVIIEHWFSLLFSVMLIKDAVTLARECMTKILGNRADPQYVRNIKQMIISEKEVQNVSNLIIHNYGENYAVGSVDIEVDEDMKASEINRISRRIIRQAKKQGLLLTSVGVIGNNTHDPKTEQILDFVIDEARKDPDILRIQGLVYDAEEEVISFRIVQNSKTRDPQASLQEMEERVAAAFPGATVEIDTAIDL